MERRAALFLTSAAVLWAAAIFFSPLAAPHPTWRLFPHLIDLAGSLVCHQRPERSFAIAGQLMPVCARCTGLYASGAAAALAAWLTVPVMPVRTRMAIVAAAVPTLLTLVVEWAGLGQPGNAGRAVAALPLGAACGWVFVRMLRAEAAPSTCAIIS
jgi:uncharacterized membrane protein